MTEEVWAFVKGERVVRPIVIRDRIFKDVIGKSTTRKGQVFKRNFALECVMSGE